MTFGLNLKVTCNQLNRLSSLMSSKKIKNINKPIGASKYKLLKGIPEYLQSQLPKSKNIELYI